ncbi:MAG: hypothetical protein U1E62_15965 [Alsobacter sp.]
MKRSALIVAVSTLALATTLASTPSFAQWRGGWGGRGGGYYHGGWGHHAYRSGWGAPLAAGVIGGLALGALASTAPYGYGYPAPVYVDPPAYSYGYGYAGTPYRGAIGQPTRLTRNSSCADVRARPSLYSENIWASCGLLAGDSAEWGVGPVR